MAKGRKPAIDGLARPQGILDDVVYPLVQKAARKVANKAMTKDSGRAYRIYGRALRTEDAMKARRLDSYYKKIKKVPMTTTKFKDIKGTDFYKSSTKSNKSHRMAAKADALERNQSVRAAAKKARQKNVRIHRNPPKI